MFGDTGTTFREVMAHEKLPLSQVQEAVLGEFLPGREDAVLFGAHAVNTYVDVRRATEDVDLLTCDPVPFGEELRDFLNQRFFIAVRMRSIRDGVGYRLYQVRKEGNRHLVDLRPVEELPPNHRVHQVLVVTPDELIANKVAAWTSRRGKPKAGSDWRDLAHLLLTFPHLKTFLGPVHDRLVANGADAAAFDAWRDLVEQEIVAENDEDEFDY